MAVFWAHSHLTTGKLWYHFIDLNNDDILSTIRWYVQAAFPENTFIPTLILIIGWKDVNYWKADSIQNITNVSLLVMCFIV